MAWHATVTRQLRASGLFSDVQLIGGKVRAVLDEALFLDIHYDPTSTSYSYALINLSLPYAGDKREFGWDDFPHSGNPDLQALLSYPHHRQDRLPDGNWQFSESSFRGDLEQEIPAVLAYLKRYLKSERFEKSLEEIVQQGWQQHPRAYTSWTHAEDQALLERYRTGMNVEQMAELHQRSVGAIRSRLKKLGETQ